MSLSIEDRVEIVLLCGREGWSQRQVAYEFNRRHPDRLQHLSHSTVGRIFNKFTRTGSVVDMKRSGRPTVTDVKETVLAKVATDPMKSLKRHAKESNMPYVTCCRILKNEKFRAYKPRLLQILYEEDFDRRSDMCECFLYQIHLNEDF